MIVKDTVFVLGAGASAPYGFPTGCELAQRICRHLQVGKSGTRFVDTDLSRAILGTFHHLNLEPRLLQDFEPAFRLAGCSSLDEFVQPPGNRRFLQLVKAATIIELVKCEKDDELTPTDRNRRGRDWYEYLFRLMRTEDPGSFTQNQVKVITFNFDRSFERRLFLFLRSFYGISDNEAAQLRFAVPTIHLHGSLGGEKWLNENRPESRDYVPEASGEQLRALLKALRIVHEEIDENDLLNAHEWLKRAHTVCFLGFGTPSDVESPARRRETSNLHDLGNDVGTVTTRTRSHPKRF